MMQYYQVTSSSKKLCQITLISFMLLMIGCSPKSDSKMSEKSNKEDVYSTKATPAKSTISTEDASKVDSLTKEDQPATAAEFNVSGVTQIEQPCGMNTQGSRIKCPSYRMVSTTIDVIDKETQHIVSTIKSNDSGDFSLNLKQGTYQLAPRKIALMKTTALEITINNTALSGLKITYKPAIQPR